MTENTIEEAKKYIDELKSNGRYILDYNSVAEMLYWYAQRVERKAVKDIDNSEFYAVVVCGGEGLDELKYVTLDAEKAVSKLHKFRAKINCAKQRMGEILIEHGFHEDSEFNTHYDRMYFNDEISWEEYSMAKYQDPDAYC